jgi:hypothetical protein
MLVTRHAKLHITFVFVSTMLVDGHRRSTAMAYVTVFVGHVAVCPLSIVCVALVHVDFDGYYVEHWISMYYTETFDWSLISAFASRVRRAFRLEFYYV